MVRRLFSRQSLVTKEITHVEENPRSECAAVHCVAFHFGSGQSYSTAADAWHSAPCSGSLKTDKLEVQNEFYGLLPFGPVSRILCHGYRRGNSSDTAGLARLNPGIQNIFAVLGL